MTGAQRRMLIIGLVPLVVLVVTAAAVTVSLIRGKLPYSYSASFVPGSQGCRLCRMCRRNCWPVRMLRCT